MPIELHGTYYTVSEAAKRLGYVSTSTITNGCQAGKIPAAKIAKTWLIPESWVREQEKTAQKGQGNRGVNRK
ncbi:MAG: helix-turn-helix domain-containing protein [Desulfovibrionaceae bacterium]